MAMGDVTVEVKDGSLGRGETGNGVGTQIKIGVSNVVSSVPLQITGTMDPDTIRAKLGNTPLADACIDSVEWGAADIRALPVKISVNGTVGTVKKTGTGTGTLRIEGTPNNAYEIVVEITDDGENNTAAFRYSLNGGKTYTEEMTVPLAGNAELEGTGLKAVFVQDEDGGSWKDGDVFTCRTTAPAMSNEDVLAAVRSLADYASAFEFVHIVGTTTRALWAALATLAGDFLTKYKRPAFFVVEARNKRDTETIDEYVTAMEQEKKGVNSIYLQAVCSWSQYQRIDGRIMDINNAGIVTGLYCQAKESQSIGEVRSFPVSEAKMLRLLPEGIEDYTARLDAAKYLTFRKYVGREDYYVTNARMLCPDGSDYVYAEDVRVSNRLVKDVHYYALSELQAEVDPGELESSLAEIEENLNTPIETARDTDKIISSGRLEIDKENLNILVDEELTAEITYVPMGHVRSIHLVFALENPYGAE